MQLLSGNEAMARGAWEAGVRVAAGYPGTPSTEILETFAPMPGIYAEWCPNEKVALDVAVGAAYAGSRSMAVMKHVGLNVAADSFFYASVTGLEAGLVIVVADDPAMHSSQNEQDTRRYAKFGRVPCLEPSDSQEAKDLVAVALDLSERIDAPVILRSTTRIAHAYSAVELGERTAEERESPPEYRIDPRKYVTVPGNARRRRPIMEHRIDELRDYASTLPINRVEMGDTSLGIVTCGVAYQYAREVFPTASFLKLGMSYPLPEKLVQDFAHRVDKLIVVEELDPCVEEEIRLLGISVEGKSIFPICGELNPAVVRNSAVQAGLLAESARPNGVKVTNGPLPLRPPVLCPGCPHRGVFHVTKKLKLVVNGDIGCYTLACIPPQEALHTCGCMGASIGVAHGVSKAGIKRRNVAVLGDSTFFHTGMPALINAAYNKGNATTIILDNRTTAMTGRQENPGTGRTLQRQETAAVDFETLARAMGIDDVHTVDSYDLDQVEEALRASLDREGPSVVIARRECALLREVRKRYLPLRVEADKCIACDMCLRVGCPALFKSDEVYAKTGKTKVRINPLLCTGCEICAQVCPKDAILFRAQIEQEDQP